MKVGLSRVSRATLWLIGGAYLGTLAGLVVLAGPGAHLGGWLFLFTTLSGAVVALLLFDEPPKSLEMRGAKLFSLLDVALLLGAIAVANRNVPVVAAIVAGTAGVIMHAARTPLRPSVEATRRLRWAAAVAWGVTLLALYLLLFMALLLPFALPLAISLTLAARTSRKLDGTGAAHQVSFAARVKLAGVALFLGALVLIGGTWLNLLGDLSPPGRTCYYVESNQSSGGTGVEKIDWGVLPERVCQYKTVDFIAGASHETTHQYRDFDLLVPMLWLFGLAAAVTTYALGRRRLGRREPRGPVEVRPV